MTLSPIIVAEPFDDRDGDGRILFGSANRKKYGTSEAIYQGTNAAGEHVYWPKGYTPEVALPPPPPPPPPVEPPVVTPADVKAALVNGETFLQNDKLTVGLNPYGGMGTLKNAPEGFLTDVETGLNRVGLYSPLYDDVVLQGRAIEGFSLMLNGKRYANMQLTGLTQIGGMAYEGARWIGSIGGVEIVQHMRLDGDAVDFEIELRNNTIRELPAGHYMRAIDPDQSDKYGTVNKVTAPGTVECGLDGGGTVTLSTDHPGAFVRAQAYNKAGDVGASAPTGKKVDEVVQLIMPYASIIPGGATTFRFRYKLS